MVSTGRRRRESRAAAKKAGTTLSSPMKPSRAKVNCRSGLAAIRSSVRLVSESSVWNSRPMATAVGDGQDDRGRVPLEGPHISTRRAAALVLDLGRAGFGK